MTNKLSRSNSLFSDSRILLSAGTLPYAPFRERVEAAGAAGFDAISLFPQQFLRARRKEKLSVSDMQSLLADNDIALDEVDPLLDWFGTGASGSEELMMEMAQALGARSINVPPAFAPRMDTSELTDIFAGVCERVAHHGLRADLEFLPWSIIPDLDTALKVVADCGQDNAGVMLDCWHFFRGHCDPAEISQLTETQIALITSLQVNDAPASPAALNARQKLAMARVMLANAKEGIQVMGPRRFAKVASSGHNPHPDAMDLMNEASGARLLPGEGDMPVAELMTALGQTGCCPTVGLEIFSVDLDRLPAKTVAAQAMTAYCEIANSAVHPN